MWETRHICRVRDIIFAMGGSPTKNLKVALVLHLEWVVQSVTFKSNKIKGLIGWAIQRLAFCEFVFNLEWTTWIQPLSSNTILCCHPFIFFDLLNWRLDVDIFPGLSRGIWNSCYSSYSKTFFLACQIILQKNGQKKQRLGSSSSLLTLKNLLGSSNILTQSWIGF